MPSDATGYATKVEESEHRRWSFGFIKDGVVGRRGKKPWGLIQVNPLRRPAIVLELSIYIYIFGFCKRQHL